MNDWQTWAAPAVVLIALALLIHRAIRHRNGCGGDCECMKFRKSGEAIASPGAPSDTPAATISHERSDEQKNKRRRPGFGDGGDG